MAINLLVKPFKRWRAYYLAAVWGRNKSIVVFTCGNCGRELKKYFDDVLVIGGDDADLIPNRWFTDAEIENIFPDYTDATSGNLPEPLIKQLGNFYKAIIGELDDEIYFVPTGSGETIMSLIYAYPEKKFVAVYNLDNATKYEENAPLNESVKKHAYDIIFADQSEEEFIR